MYLFFLIFIKVTIQVKGFYKTGARLLKESLTKALAKKQVLK